MQYTDQQQACIQSNAKTLVINAFAGAAKTTTLEGYSNARPKARILNVCFNKSVQINADKSFPKNVRNKTSHALAFPNYGARFADAKKLKGNLRVSHVLPLIPKTFSKPVSYAFAAAVIETVTAFIISGDEALSIKHTATTPKSNFFEAQQLVPYAKTVWGQMQDLNNPMPMVHDGYFKMWQLTHPIFSNYDILLLDEFQDTSPALMSIVSEQSITRVMVGDKHQAIYQFRGAINAMQYFESDEELNLTTSFRYGKKIAYLANLILFLFKDETVRIKGFKPEDHIGYIDDKKPYAVISKTNIGLFEQAITAVNKNLPIHYIGSIEGYGLDQIMDTYHLMTGSPFMVKDDFLRTFLNFTDLKLYAEEANDFNVKNLVKICETYQNKIPEYIDKIRRSNVEIVNPNPISKAIEHTYAARVFLSTAHKSKGLEFDQVILADDFTAMTEGDRFLDDEDIEEQDINLIYVALTRAKHTLQINQQLKDVVTLYRELKAKKQANG